MALLKGSKLHFDRSGLGVNDSREAYDRIYGLPEIYEDSSRDRAVVYRIAPGEALIFGLDGSYVLLAVYD